MKNKDNKENRFDLSEIKKNISAVHNNFTKNKSMISYKVESDKELKKTRVISKIRSIIIVMKETGVIDDFAEQNPSNVLGVDTSVTCFVLCKKGYSNYIYVMTDGSHIVIKDSSFMIDFGSFGSYLKHFYVLETVDSFDWNDFSLKLLDHIHACIYNRVGVNEISVFSQGNNNV